MLPSDPYKNDSLEIVGNLTVKGINKIVINTESGVLPSGTYSLIHWTGTFTGSVANFDIDGISGIPVSLIIENNTLKLVVNDTRPSGLVSWTGKENGNWDFTSANFNISGNPTYFVNNDTVQFTDSASIKTIVLTDNMTTSETKFMNNTPYTLQGTGGISGNGNLIKTSKGMLNIQTTNNSYTGKTIFDNACVQIASLADAGSASSIGASTADPSNISLNNTQLIINSATTNTNHGITLAGIDSINIPKSNGVVTITGKITGNGTLVKNGPGQFNISGTIANDFSGGTIINGGNLALGSVVMNTSGLGSGPITFENGGKLSMYNSTSDYSQKPVWNITIDADQTGTISASGRCIIGGSLSGAGTLNFLTPYVRTDWTTNCANFSGVFNVITDADGGTFRITANPNGLPFCTVNLANLVSMGAYSSTGSSSTSNSTVVKIGALSGVSGSSVSGGTWLIGNNNQDAVYNGIFSPGATVTKIGTGNWTLTGTSTNSTSFNINAGKVIASNTVGSATGTGAVYVNQGATLAGTGIVSGQVIVNSGGVLSPGTTIVGTLSLGSNLSLQTGSKTTIKLTATSNDKIIVNGIALLKGTLEMQNNGSYYQAGKSYVIFNATSSTGNFDQISPDTPGTGLKWNTSLINQGVISIDLADGIEDINGADIRVFPTQINEYCIVEFGNLKGNVSVELIDEVGKMIYSIKKSASESMNLNLSTLHPGFYLIKITDDKNQSFLRKVIKV